MTKVLQIRRGTTAANDNFTGLAGELTMDTDAKTVRIHDGVRLGGYALARADSITPGTAFDITTVPDTFWETMLARLRPNIVRVATGESMALTNLAYVEDIFDLGGATPLFAQCVLECVSSDAGFAVGDAVYSFGVGTRTATAPNMFSDSDGVHVRLMVGGDNFWVAHAETGVHTAITNANWRIKFRIYY